MIPLKEVRAWLRGSLPEGLLQLGRSARDTLDCLTHRGTDVTCPLCGSSFSRFTRFNRRDDARCPRCGSLERHRLLWLYLERCTDLFVRPQLVLHVAPERFLRDRLARTHGTGYVHGDIADPKHFLDVTDLPHEGGAFDVALCSHVFEHVPDDHEAVRQFARVLAPGGWAILDAPVDERRESTYEDSTITSHKGRRRHFGQWDHVRVYGRDYADLLRGAGFVVEPNPFEVSSEDVARYGLRPDKDHVFLCRKPARTG